MKVFSYRMIGVIIVCLIGGECRPLPYQLENDGSTTEVSTDADMTEEIPTTTFSLFTLPRSRRDADTNSPHELTSTLEPITETIVPRSRRDADTSFPQELTSTLEPITETILPIDESSVTTDPSIYNEREEATEKLVNEIDQPTTQAF